MIYLIPGYLFNVSTEMSQFSSPVDLNINLEGYHSELSSASSSSLPSTRPFSMERASVLGGIVPENPKDAVTLCLDYVEKSL